MTQAKPLSIPKRDVWDAPAPAGCYKSSGCCGMRLVPVTLNPASPALPPAVPGFGIMAPHLATPSC